MNEQSFFQWDLVRQPLQGQAFGMGASLLDFSILELRKEKSRDAARSRRGKENYEFYELAKLLPLPAAITSQLDKASIIRLSISYLKLREFSGHGDPPWNRDMLQNNKTIKGHGRRRNLTSVDLIDSHQGTHILQSLDGFAFILGNDGRFLYISETVSIYLGLSQVEMTGSSIFDYVHHADHNELAEYLGLGFHNECEHVIMSKVTYEDVNSDQLTIDFKEMTIGITTVVSNAPSPGSTSDEGSAPSTPRPMSPSSPERVAYMIPNPDRPLERTFCLRMKSTLTKRGVHVRTSGYRVVYITAHFRPQLCFNLNRKSTTQYLGLVGVAIALPPPTITELRIESDTFIMRLTPNLKVIYCDTMISELSDWKSDDINNRMFYDFCHAGDVLRIKQHHQDLMTKGQALTDYFRFMNKNGGYVWVQMCATTLFSSKTSDDHTILAIIYVLSGILHRGCVMDQNQTTSTTHHFEQSEIQSEHGSEIDENQKDTLPPHHTSPSHDPWDANVTSSQPIENLHDSTNDLENIVLEKGHGDHCLTPDDLIESQEEAARIISDNLNDKINQTKSDFKYSRRKTEKPKKRKRDYRLDQEDCLNGNRNILLNRNMSHDDKMERCSSTSNASNHNEDYEVSDNGEHTLYSVTEDMSRRSSTTHIREEQHLESDLGWQNLDDINHNSVASSVKDLEDVMNRHLPVISENRLKIPTDLSTQQIHVGGAINRQRSAIQWAGNSHENSTLPASNLLRTLYANRESVIRSSSRPSYVSSDAVNLLTPPENDGQKEHLTLNIPHIIVSKHTALPPYSSSLSSTVSCNLQDTFDITPPASVSPNDKLPSQLYDGHYEHSSASSSLAAPIPVKSQAFSLSFVSPSPEYNSGAKLHPTQYQVTEHPQFVYGGNSSSGVIYDSWY